MSGHRKITFFKPEATFPKFSRSTAICMIALMLLPIAGTFLSNSFLDPFGGGTESGPVGSVVGSSAAAEERAQSEGGGVTLIRGRLQVRVDGERMSVEGVNVSVSLDGAAIGQDTSDENGNWEILLPGAGTYVVSLDTSTLPDGVSLTDAGQQTLEDINVDEGQRRTLLFRLGEGVSSTSTRAERIANLVYAGIQIGAILALCSVGLSLVYGASGLINFAHGDVITFGAFIAFFWNVSDSGPEISVLANRPELHIIWGVLIAMVVTGFLSGASEIVIWRPLRNRQVPLLSVMLVTIGLSFIIRFLVAVFFGVERFTYRDYAIQETISIGWINATPKSLLVVLISLALLTGLGLFLIKTPWGISIRAVSSNRELASVAGINVSSVLLLIWLVGGSLSALGGAFFGIIEQIDYLMGFRFLLLIFASVILGGIGTAFGAMAGGFFIGIASEVSTYWIDSEFKIVVALLILILMLLVRPQGLLGRRERVA